MELQEKLEEFKARGMAVIGISYDSVHVLREFSETRNIAFPLLADPESKVIRQIGVMNTELDSTGGAWGSAFPGLYTVDKDLKIIDKQFEQSYYERPTVEGLLVSKFGKQTEGPMRMFSTGYLDGFVALTDSVAHLAQIVTVTVELNLKDGFHVYGKPIPKGYFPLQIEFESNDIFEVDPFEFPEPAAFSVAGLDEAFFVYSGKLKLQSKLRVKTRRNLGDHMVRARLTLQACNKTACMMPLTRDFEFPLKVVKWDKRVVGE